jgi:membrane-associated phospholipid phosphatase
VRPSERLTLAATVFLAALTLALRPDGAAPRILVFLGCAAATWLLSRAPARGDLRFLRDWLPVAIVIVTYLLLQPIIEAGVPWRLDATLAAVDDRYLGGLRSTWRGAFGRPDAFTDAIYAAYFSYYLLPITVAALARREGPATFERAVFALLLAFYLTFAGYLALPASGPRLPYAIQAQALGGGVVSDAVRAFLATAETTTLDAFPSGHTTIPVVAAVVATRLTGRTAAVAIWAWASAIVFATVYIDVHYVVDVLAGFALAAVVLLARPVSTA